MSSPLERDFAHLGGAFCSFRADAIENSAEQRRLYEAAANIVTPEQMPMENSPEGLIKHLVNERMTTKECCVEAYMQFLPPGGRSGKHRHMWEEVLFVVEGSGYDLHWDLKFDCLDKLMAARRLHLCPPLHHPPAFQRRQRERSAVDRDQ
jgi:hypothetical protein